MNSDLYASVSPRVVIDTNVALDWLLFDEPSVQALTTAITAGQLSWLACPFMREELAQMLRHASLARWQPDADVALALFDRHTTLLPPPVVNSAQRLICSDRDDQVFIDLAICARVDWLITHDRALLKLARRALRFGVRVVRPVDWPPPASGR